MHRGVFLRITHHTSHITFAHDLESSPPRQKLRLRKCRNPANSNGSFRAFAYRDFRLLWFGAFTSSAGTWMQETAQSWFILQLTNQPLFLGLNTFLATAPILLFSLIGGVVADRMDRRRILLTSQWLATDLCVHARSTGLSGG